MKKIVFILLMTTGIAYGQKPYVIAHRGNSSVAPENTIAAYTKAVETEADYFELDVQCSGDDSLMLMHDNTVDRTTDGTGTLEAMTYASLRLLDAGSWFNSSFAGEKIPTLWEALMVAKNSSNNIKVVIEIKSSNATIVTKVVQLIKRLHMENRVIVSSFNFSQISESKSLEATIPVMFFNSPVTNADIDQVAGINGEWVGSGGSYTQDVIDYAHGKSVLYNAWTVDNESTMRTLISQGVDAITTNTPAALIAIKDPSPPSDVVLASVEPQTSSYIKLTWDRAVDTQSGIYGYKVYRDETSPATTLIDSAVMDTFYMDQTTTSLHTYFYRIKAKNTVGISSVNYSNERSATALNDSESPVVAYITSKLDSITVLVEFNEPVDKNAAETLSNYHIDNGVNVTSAELAINKKTIILQTSALSAANYLLSVQNVKDLADNVMEPEQFQFEHKRLITGAIAVYKLDAFESDTLIIDETNNHNDGKARKGVKLSEGKFGNALSFDGIDDYVLFQNTPSFNIGGNKVTVSLWAKLEYKPTALPGSYGPLFDSQTDEYSLYEDKGNKQLRFKTTAAGGGAAKPGIADAEVVTGEWIYVVGVYDGANTMIYLNGSKKAEVALTGNVRAGNIPMLGKSGTSGTISYLKGCIDEVEIYNRVLSEDEIMEKYSQVKNEAVPFFVDSEKPVVEYVTSKLDSITVLVEFNEPVDTNSAVNTTNYSIDNGVNIASAELAIDRKTVILETSALSDRKYVLGVQNVKDLADNVMEPEQFQFEHKKMIFGAIAIYKLDAMADDTVVVDETKNHNDGRAKKGPKLAEGIIGNALSFDGFDDFVQFQNSASFDIGGDKVTVSLWAKIEYKPSALPGAYGPLFDSETDDYVLYADKGNNQLRFKVTSLNGPARPGIAGADVITGEWAYIVGVYDGANAMIYQNGVKKAGLPLTGNIRAGQIAMMGKSGTVGTPSYFKGSIDQVEIYNRALTENEILEKYSQVKNIAVPYTDPVSVKDNLEPSQIVTIYPNPVAINTVIKLDGLYQDIMIRVYDTMGRTIDVSEYSGLSEISLDCSRFDRGIYFVNVTLNNTLSETKRIVVK